MVACVVQDDQGISRLEEFVENIDKNATRVTHDQFILAHFTNKANKNT